ncbi:peptidase PPPDE4 [Leishmania donovani]|uniref:PPPDE putative peptidase domain family protein n=1 Tax=Leishmania donovani TaxID=5661 RepID=A0A504XPX4_LEIDO|nr:PPPDE putative peptidase domain family protein [Leishmania donovani]CAJ1991673.1 peptidase PPPDE4 [Leishmania donovani]VDZ47512.1 PPPDE_putative_peptidase_domain_containing_protein_putative/Pfam:PF05903 [Leishmania donovani]
MTHTTVVTSPKLDPALYEKMQHTDPLPQSESVLLPSKTVLTPVRKSDKSRLPLCVDKGASKENEEEEQKMGPLLRIATTEVPSRTGVMTPLSSRHLSVSCVPVEATTCANRPLARAPQRLCIGRVAALRPPNDTSVPGAAVRDGQSFLLDRCKPTARDMVVELHVYDLSHGHLKRYGQELVGLEMPGVYHSGIVCYGVEVYFEGGIGIAAAGRTRFGSKYRTHNLGVTKKPVSEFFRWIGVRAIHVNQIHDYHPVRHNCHHFSHEAARFLLGESVSIPKYLFSTVDNLVKTEVGASVAEVMTLTTHGMQSSIARQMRSRTLERQCSIDMQLSASTACGVMTLPPTAAVLFRPSDLHLAKRLVLDLSPYVKGLIKRKHMKPAALAVLEGMACALMEGTDSLAPKLLLNYVEIVTESLLRSPLVTWGPIFNGLRVAVLHKLCLINCVFHTNLMSMLMLAARDFLRLLPDGRVAFLRLACNFACGAYGAIVYSETRYRDAWVSIVGLGLMDSSSIVVYTAACLALNLALGIVTTSNLPLKRDMTQQADEHYALRLVTLLLYNLRHRSADQLPEPSFNMILMALYRLASSNTAALEYVVSHPFKPRYSELLDRCGSNESRALVCLLQTLEDLYA